jgi:TonB family protein
MKRKFCLFVFFISITVFTIAQDSKETEKLIKEKNFKPVLNMLNPFFSSDTNINDRWPLFIGGQEGFKQYLLENMVYPEKAKKEKISGIVTFDFVITSTGKVTQIRINSSPNELLSNEVIRVMNNSGPWLPGISENKYKSMRMSKSFEFK